MASKPPILNPLPLLREWNSQFSENIVTRDDIIHWLTRHRHYLRSSLGKKHNLSPEQLNLIVDCLIESGIGYPQQISHPLQCYAIHSPGQKLSTHFTNLFIQ